MIHRAFTIASVASLLLSMIAAVLWVKSYSSPGEISRNGETGWFFVHWKNGTFYTAWEHILSPVNYDRDHLYPLSYNADGRYNFTPDRYGAPWATESHWGRIYFDHARMRYASGRESGAFVRWASAPCWSVLVITSLLPILFLNQLLRRRGRSGYCRVCGYDLRVSKDRCPECGTQIPLKTEATA